MGDEKQRDLLNNKKDVITTTDDNSHVPSAQAKVSGNSSRPSSGGGKHSSSSAFSLSKRISSLKAAASRTSANLKTTLAGKKEKTVTGEKQRTYRPVRSSLIIAGIIALILLLVIIAVVIRAATDSQEYSRYFSIAEEYYYAKDYSSALSYFRKASRVDETEDVKAMMAECYYAEGNYAKALEVLRTMDTRDPDITEKIHRIEAERIASEAPESVNIAGKSYPVTTTSLVLDSSGLTDEDVKAITGLYSLTNLSVANNFITDISPLSVLGGLASLNLSNNRISDISALSSLSSLRVLYLDGNPVSDFSSLLSLPQLSMLSIKGVKLDAKQREALSISLPNCALHTEAAVSSSEQISLGGKTFSVTSEQLDLSNMGISDISSLSECTNLRFLNLSGNNISDISPLLDIPNLETLVLSDNSISNIYPLMGLTSLRYLYLDGNDISGISALSSISGLIELYIADNPITSLSGIETLNYIETLDISGIEASDEMLTQLYSSYSLKLIILNNNPDLTGNAVDALDDHLQNCSITHDDLPYIIDIAGNRFLSTDTYIDLSGLGLTDITWINSFSNPETVNLSNNRISNLYVLKYVTNVGSIKKLDLSHNSIIDINSIVYLTGIEDLNLSYTAINSINPLKELTTLKELHIVGTKLSEKQIVELCNALPNCTVHYKG